MILDVNLTISDRQNTQGATLRSSITHILDSAPAKDRDDARCNGRLCDKIFNAELTVDLNDEDLKRIKRAIDANKNMTCWAVEGLEYYLWPEELADSDRERLASRYSGGAINAPEET